MGRLLSGSSSVRWGGPRSAFALHKATAVPHRPPSRHTTALILQSVADKGLFRVCRHSWRATAVPAPVRAVAGCVTSWDNPATLV